MRSHRLVPGLAAVSLIALAATAAAQSPTPPADPDPLRSTTFNVTFEGYYEYNGNRPPDRVNLLRAYDTRANSFSIQQVALVIENAPDRDAGRAIGLRVDLQFGQVTETAQGNPANEPRPNAYRNLWQAYGSYVFPGSRAIRLDFGKFGSSLGIETNYAKDNTQFSRALLFDFLPLYHNGLRLQVPVNDKVAVFYMLTNGVQQTEDANNFKSNHVMAVVTPSKTVSWTANYYAGQEQPDGGEPNGPNGWFRVLDTYVTCTPIADVSLSVDVNHTTNQTRSIDPASALNGVGLYARYAIDDTHAIAARYERLRDDGLFVGVRQALQEFTITAEHKAADGFLVRAEFRRDSSDVPLFPGRDAARTHQTTALVGLVWWIGAKPGAW